MSWLACKYCASDRGFEEVGEVTCAATRELRLSRAEDGTLAVRGGSVDVDSFYADDIDVDSVRCRECGAEASIVEELIGPPTGFAAGTVVRCPDGLRGTVAEVDMERRLLRVEGWHEWFEFAEVEPILGAPRQMAVA